MFRKLFVWRKPVMLVGMFVLLVITARMAGYRVNISESYPYGIWKLNRTGRDEIGRGEFVLYCPPTTEIFRQARDRGYLSMGLCPSGVAPLLKRIAAIEGDRVVVTDQAVSVNGRQLDNSTPLLSDRVGRPMPVAPSSMVRVGMVWLYSDYNPRSFDSRYFGQVPTSGIKGIVEPVWLWHGEKILRMRKKTNGDHRD